MVTKVLFFKVFIHPSSALFKINPDLVSNSVSIITLDNFIGGSRLVDVQLGFEMLKRLESLPSLALILMLEFQMVSKIWTFFRFSSSNITEN